MISSIRIKGSEDIRIKGSVSISTDNTIGLWSGDSSIHINRTTPEKDPKEEYLDALKSSGSAPYVSKITGVSPDAWGNVWLLGGKTFQVDYTTSSTSELTLCDMAQTVDYPRIYMNVYNMLRRIRLWVDAHKDNLLLDPDRAYAQWTLMNGLSHESNDNWRPKENPFDKNASLTFTEDSRSREEIMSLGTPINLLNEYLGVVALWNHIVGTPRAEVDVRLHPADQAGLYIGANMVVPILKKEDTKIRLDISVSFTGQTGDNLYTWSRIPVCKVIPGGKSITTSVVLEGDSSSVSKTPSILDNGSQKQGTSVQSHIEFTIPKDSVHTSHTIQCVLEAIPFYLCSTDEKTYADSKKAEHYSKSGENVWTIKIDIYRNDEKDPVNSYKYTKNTAYTTVCESDESESGSGAQ